MKMTRLASRGLQEILSFIAPSIREILVLMPGAVVDGLEEVRLRMDRPLI
jgi:stage III sporulation protein AA